MKKDDQKREQAQFNKEIHQQIQHEELKSAEETARLKIKED